VGEVWVDTYEASVWEIAAAHTGLINKVRKSKIAAAAHLAAPRIGIQMPKVGH